jgi:hypothetical protein
VIPYNQDCTSLSYFIDAISKNHSDFSEGIVLSDYEKELWFTAVEELNRFHIGETNFYGGKMDNSLPSTLIDLLQRSGC